MNIPLLNFIFFFLVLLPLGSTSCISTQKPGCPDRCGDISIPYPFGVGSDCSLEASFNITCNTSSNPHKPYLNIDNEKILQVVDIKLDNPPQIRIKYPYPLSVACYNISADNKRWKDWNTIDLQETYTISEDNWLTAIGCDDFVAATTWIGNQSFRDACIGYYWMPNYSTDLGTCPSNGDGNSVGEGCCRSPISKGEYKWLGWNNNETVSCGAA